MRSERFFKFSIGIVDIFCMDKRGKSLKFVQFSFCGNLSCYIEHVILKISNIFICLLLVSFPFSFLFVSLAYYF